jgi:putative membrane protein
MAGKLYRFMTPLGLIALALGLVLWLGYGVSGGWLHAKLTLVAGLIVYHLMCRHFLQVFIADANTRSHTWFRVFNEIPVLMLLAVVLLVIVKPF